MRTRAFYLSRMLGATLVALALSFGMAARSATASCGKAGCGDREAACSAEAQPAKRPQCTATTWGPQCAATQCAPVKKRPKCLAGAANCPAANCPCAHCPQCAPGNERPECAKASACPKHGACCHGLKCRGRKPWHPGPAGNLCAEGAGRKLVRGVTNVGFCWFEVIEGAQQSLVAHKGWGLCGILDKSIHLPFAVAGGALHGAERAVSGVVETAFSPFPPYGPMIDPAWPPYLRSSQDAAGKGVCPCVKAGNCPKAGDCPTDKACPKRKAGDGPESCPKANSSADPGAEASGCPSQ